MFGIVSSGEIINLKIYDATIYGGTRVGVLAGDVTGASTISSVTVIESSVTGSVTIGGVIGRSSSLGSHQVLGYSGSVSGVISTSTGHNIGGVIGKMQNNTKLTKSYFNGNISGREDVGGLVGKSKLLSHPTLFPQTKPQGVVFF